MTPFASVAMLEKLALLKIAFCSAPAFSSTSSACAREVTSAARSETLERALAGFFPRAIRLSPVIYTKRFSVSAAGRAQKMKTPPMSLASELLRLRERDAPLCLSVGADAVERLEVPWAQWAKRL